MEILASEACSIFEAVVETGTTRRFILTGTTCEGDSVPIKPDLGNVAPDQIEQERFYGYTRFAVITEKALLVPDVRAGMTARRPDGTDMALGWSRQPNSQPTGFTSELTNPGPLLIVPFRRPDAPAVEGAVRVVRSQGRPPFTATDQKALEDLATLLALLLSQTRTKRELVREMATVEGVRGDDEQITLAVAQAARMLVPASTWCGIYLTREDVLACLAAAGDWPRHATIKATSERGLVALTWRTAEEPILSNDLKGDINRGDNVFAKYRAHDSDHPGGPSREGRAQSLIGLKIPGRSGEALGVIKLTSAKPYAFAYDDVVTMQALADRTATLLERERSRRYFENSVDSDDTPIVATSRGVVDYANRAALKLLGVEEAKGKALVELLFEGRAPLATHLEGRVDELIEQKRDHLDDHYTTLFQAGVPIPVRVSIHLHERTDPGRRAAILRFDIPDFARRPLVASPLEHKGKDGRPPVVKAWTADTTLAQRLVAIGERASRLPLTRGWVFFITGETGTGKRVLAEWIHHRSKRNALPFVDVNCGTLHPNTACSDLFGSSEGAYTGAVKRDGLFAGADRGSIFLDDVDALDLTTQVALLQVFDRQVIRRMGTNEEARLNLNIIVATNAKLDELVKAGTFREDLMARMHSQTFWLPPLRERQCDIMLVAMKLLDAQAVEGQEGAEPEERLVGWSSKAVAALMGHDWPRNVRELERAVEEAYHARTQRKSSGTPGLIDLEDLPLPLQKVAPWRPTPRSPAIEASETSKLERRVAALERALDALSASVEPAEGPAAKHDESLTEALRKWLLKKSAVRSWIPPEGTTALINQYVAENPHHLGRVSKSSAHAVQAEFKTVLQFRAWLDTRPADRSGAIEVVTAGRESARRLLDIWLQEAADAESKELFVKKRRTVEPMLMSLLDGLRARGVHERA
jgi:transcriptional regulator with AAA-type ATPase domain/GAF domain-containing protein